MNAQKLPPQVDVPQVDGPQVDVPQDAARVDAPRRRFLDWPGPTPTVIGTGSVFVGDIRAIGTLVVSGSIEGDGDLAGDLNLSAVGKWHGNIHARCAIIAGSIVGDLTVADRLEIGQTAVIRGRVRARTIAIAKGAIVEGDVEVTTQASVLHFEEKRDR
jgi:cytoskeletal protein CcmA (bactofilin family)